jgi:predicted peptidase
MSHSQWLAIALSILVAAPAARAEDKLRHGFEDRVHKDDAGEAKYVVFVPEAYDGMKPFPLVLFLHGSGATGEDGKRQVSGIAAEIRRHEKTFPAIVIFPQSHDRTWRANSADGKRAMAILNEVEKAFKVDHERVYLTGLSMGGFGTWSLAAAHPDRWAAIVPICGGGNTKDAAKIKDIPCWCFHGDADPTVNVEQSRSMIKALKEAGGQPKYTEYPGVPHDSWTRMYANPELYQWLWKQKRGGKPEAGESKPGE